MLAFLDSPVQLIFAAVVILVVFGPQKLPEIAGQIGRALRELKRTTSELQETMSLDHSRYDDHYNPPSYDSYGNPAAYSETTTASISESDMRHESTMQGALPAAEPVRGDFAASAMADTGSDYGVGMSTSDSVSGVSAYGGGVGSAVSSESAVAAHDIVARPAEGSVARSS